MDIREANAETSGRVERAITHLKAARDELKLANCPKAVERTRKALSSAEGAKRHAQHRTARMAL